MTNIKNTVLKANGVVLRPMAQDDLDMVRAWRNDPQIKRNMLTQRVISKSQQTAWFNAMVTDESRLYHVIEFRCTPIGVASLRTFDGLSLAGRPAIETGLYIADERYRGTLLAFCPAITLNDFAFSQLRTDKLVARVLANNLAAIRFNETLGYKFGACDHAKHASASKSIRVMNLSAADFTRETIKLRKFIRY